MSESITEGVRITVKPAFWPERSSPEQNQWAFTYAVTVVNEGTRAATLRARHWVITDASGRVEEVRGEGLLIGLKAVIPAGDLVAALRAEKLLTVGAGENVVRLLPPLIVTEAEIDDAMSRLERVCAKFTRAPALQEAAR